MSRAGAWCLASAVFLAAAGTEAPATPVIEIQASTDGFRPRQVDLRRGERVRIVLTSADGEHCFAVDDLRIEKRIVPGRETRFELTPDQPGRFVFFCCLESGGAAQTERGELLVGE